LVVGGEGPRVPKGDHFLTRWHAREGIFHSEERLALGVAVAVHEHNPKSAGLEARRLLRAGGVGGYRSGGRHENARDENAHDGLYREGHPVGLPDVKVHLITYPIPDGTHALRVPGAECVPTESLVRLRAGWRLLCRRAA